MSGGMTDWLTAQLQSIRDAGLYKEERVLTSPQSVRIRTDRRGGSQFLRQQLPGAREPSRDHPGGQRRAG